MNVAFRTAPPTLDEFLAWEREQELRHEFDGREVVPMVGGTLRHGRIALNLAATLGATLGDGTCQVFPDGVKVVVAGRVRYPDATVTCSAVDWDSDIVPDPIAVFEVLSPGTARTDWLLKTEEYRTAPSIQHYVLLEQAAEAAHVFTRVGETWTYAMVQRGGEVALAAIGASFPLAACYAGMAAP